MEFYRNDNDGAYPETLQILVDNHGLPPETITTNTYPGFNYDSEAPAGQLFYYTLPAPGADPGTNFLVSTCIFSGDRRVVAKLDGSVRTERFPVKSAE